MTGQLQADGLAQTLGSAGDNESIIFDLQGSFP
jgi:hypothetical protein